MGAFDLDFASLRAVVAPDRIPLRGNEHRITRVAFDLFKLDNDKENLWQVQADDDGNEFLVRTYELPKDESIQATSDWDVVLDSRKASLTVSYRGMPIHRLVAADFGAQGQDDAALLRDLVQAKLSDGEFAARMLATLPEPKRAALQEMFPKLAVAKLPLKAQPVPKRPKIPMPTGKDPLEGIAPVDVKKEYGIDPKAKSAPAPKAKPVPMPKTWATHPQAAEDPWKAQAFVAEAKKPSNMAEAQQIAPRVVEYLEAHQGKKVSLQELYMELDCNDIPLYLALHALVKRGLIDGASPYDAPSAEMAALTGQPDVYHEDLFYSVGGEKLQNADEGEGEGKQEPEEPKEMGRLEEGFQHLQNIVKHRENTAIEKAVAIAKEMGHNGHFEKHNLPMIVFYFHEGDAKAEEFLAKMYQAGYYGTLVGPGWAAVKLPGL